MKLQIRTLAVVLALSTPAFAQDGGDGITTTAFPWNTFIKDQNATCQDAWFQIGKSLYDTETVGQIKFGNAVDSMTSYGLRVDAGTNTNKGHQVAVRAQTSADNFAGQKGTAVGQLALSGGYFSSGAVRGVYGDADVQTLSNFGVNDTSRGIGGWFIGGPSGTDTLTLGTGNFEVGGVYGEARGDVVGGDSTSRIVAGVIGRDNTSSPASGTSWAGWFDGDVLSTTGVYVASARQQAENVRPITGALASVLRLRGVTYGLADGGGRAMGFLADEVGDVVQEVVRFDGSEATAIDYARLTALLVEATKDQQVLIDALRSEIEALRGERAR